MKNSHPLVFIMGCSLSLVSPNLAWSQALEGESVVLPQIECELPKTSGNNGQNTPIISPENTGSPESKKRKSQSKKRKVASIAINNNTIFDESEEDTMAIHHIANWLHITTKEGVIRERLPFKEGDVLDDDDLLEAERIIRSQAYIRDVRISFKESCDINEPAQVEIQTWDNWSLIPTLSFGRKGGENKLSIGIKEDNVLGTGIRARFKYNSDEQRTGYQFTLKSPFPYVPYSTVFLDFQDNDDGQLTHLEFDKPFYHLRTENMFNATFLQDKKTEDIFQNGLTRNSFNESSHLYALSGGWQLSQQDKQSTRLKFGYIDNAASFEPTIITDTNDALFLPQDRSFQYPWVGLEYVERKFKTMTDVYLIKQTEDINLGWHHEVKLGIELNDVAANSNAGYHISLTSSKGYELFDGLLMLSGEGEGHFNTSNPDQFSMNGNIEYFKRYNDLIGLYARFSGTASNNAFFDQPITVGDDTGIRGYPLQYQHGDHQFSSSIEARFYTDYNLFKVLDLGFVGFADAGKAWGGEQAEYNETDALLTSIGVGMRLYSSRSSHKSVIHMDISKPFETSANVDSWQWRLQIKRSF